MANDTFYLLAPPEQAPALRPWDAFPALFTCKLGEGGELLCRRDAGAVRGGVLVLSDGPGALTGPADRLALTIIKECLRRGGRGLLLDFDARDGGRGELIVRLARLLRGQGITLFVPEYYASAAPEGRVLISSALSGGTLEDRLAEALARFGPDRTVLALERAAEEFSLPAPDGCGTPLSDARLREMREGLRPSVWFSEPLCARYFTRQTETGEVRFVLFDDGETLRRKVERARRVGLRRFLLPWAEVREEPGAFGMRRR